VIARNAQVGLGRHGCKSKKADQGKGRDAHGSKGTGNL
jgi:hypothetical protein